MATGALKFRSRAALLLVVTVLVGTCASGAYADGSGTVDLVNLCSNDTFIATGDAVTGILVKAGAAVGLDLSMLQNIIGPVYIRKNGVVYVIPTDTCNQILGLTGILYKIEIACDGECGVGTITIKPCAQAYVLGEPTGPPVTDTFCVDVVANP